MAGAPSSVGGIRDIQVPGWNFSASFFYIVRLRNAADQIFLARERPTEAAMYIIARNISGPRLRCEALMVDKKTFTPWPPVSEDGWRRAYKFRDRLMAEVVRLEIDPLGEELKVIEAVYIR
jgi:hypothetical protein